MWKKTPMKQSLHRICKMYHKYLKIGMNWLILLALLGAVASLGFHPLHSNELTRPFIYEGDVEILRTTTRQYITWPTGEISLLNVPDVFQNYNYSSGHCLLEAICNFYAHSPPPYPYREADFTADYDFDEDHFASPDKLIAAALARFSRETRLPEKDVYDVSLKQNMSMSQLEGFLEIGVPVMMLVKGNEGQPSGSYLLAIGTDNSNFYFEDPWRIGSVGYLPKSQLKDFWKSFIKSQGKWAIQNGIVFTLKEGIKQNIVPLVRPLP